MLSRLFARWQRKASTCRASAQRRPLVLEALEDRTLLSPVTWTNPGSGSWDVPGNWSGGSVPGSGDDVVISTAARATILIQAGDTEQVNSLMTAAGDTLSLTGGGSLSVLATSTLSGGLSIDDGILAVDGAGVVFSVNGPTMLTSPHLAASNGAQIDLHMAGTIATESGVGGSLIANGSGCVIDLSGVTSLDASVNGLTFETFNGARIDLQGLSAITQPNVVFHADNGVIDLSALTEFDSTGNNQLSATDGATILDPMLTVWNGVVITLDGTSTIASSQWTTLTNGSLLVTGGTYPLSSLTNLDGTGVSATAGAQVSLPALSTIANGNDDVLIDADGIGTQIDMPALTSFTGTFSRITVSNEATLNAGGTVINGLGSGAAATIDIPALPAGLQVPVDIAGGTYTDGTTINVGQGTSIAISGGTFSGGVHFSLGTGATLDLAGTGSVTYSGTLTGSGPGTVQLGSGTLDAGLGGVTLNFAGGMFQWTGGMIALDAGDVINLGTMNLVGPNGWTLLGSGTMDNFGTIRQSGTGDLGLHNGDPNLVLTLKIEPNAFYSIESDSRLVPQGTPLSAVENAGTIRKIGGTGIASLIVNGPIDNSGIIEVDSGTLDLEPTSIDQISGNTLTGGTWVALNGSTLEFPANTDVTSNAGNISLAGAGAAITGLANLASNGGSFAVTSGAAFTTAGDFANTGDLTIGAGSTLAVTGNFTQASGGTLHEQIGGTPASGLFGQIAVTQQANLAGAFDLALVNGFNPSAGQTFAALTFNHAAGSFATFSGLAPFFTETLASTSLNLLTAANGVDLATSNVTAPTAATAGRRVSVTWRVTNQANQAATGNWQDSVFISTTPVLTASSILFGTVLHSGGLSVGAHYDGSITTSLGALPPGFYYVLVQSDSLYQVADSNRANNTVAASNGQLGVSLPALNLGTPLNDSFTAADQDRYYQVTAPAGGALVIAVQSTAAAGAVALYVSQGALPTPFNSQQAADVANQPNQTVTVPQVPAAGTYFVLVHSVSGNAATAGFALTASQTSGLSVSAISATSGGNAGNATVEIDGTNFTSALTATLTLGATTLSATAVDFVNASQVFVTFNLTGAAVGSYALAVQVGAMSANAPAAFSVTTASPPTPLSVQLVVPAAVRVGGYAVVYVNYENTSANDISAPLLQIASSDGSVLFSTPANPNLFRPTAQVLAVSPSGPAGILRHGDRGTLSFSFTSTSTSGGTQLPIELGQLLPGQPIDLASQQAALRPSTVTAAAWDVVFGKLQAAVGTTTDSYTAALDQAATYLSGIGESAAQVGDVNRLWTFLVAQAAGEFPHLTLASATDASLPAPGNVALAIDRKFQSSIISRNQQGIFGMGWATSWQSSLSADAAGNVTIDAGGQVSFFVAGPSGTYRNINGEYGTLSSAAGVFTFTDTKGTVHVFLPNGRLSYVQDTNGNRVTLAYNAQNQLGTLTRSNPANPAQPPEQLTLTYNPQGLVSQVADGTGSAYAYIYDAAGHLLSVTAPGGLTTLYTYDTGSNPVTANALLSITSFTGAQQSFTYDAQGRLSGTSQNGGADAIAYAYLGQAELTVTDAAGHTTTVWLNELGLPARAVDARGIRSAYRYDLNGKLVTYNDTNGRNLSFGYDGQGNLLTPNTSLSQRVYTRYDALSNLSLLVDGASHVTRYAYDSAGNLLSITYPGGGKQTFAYDPVGNLSETILQNGDAVGYQHNAQGLVTRQSFADGTSQSFAYDAHGNLLTAKSFNSHGALTGTTTLTYNAANQLTSIAYPGGQHLTFTYNANGQRIQSVDQSGFTVNYAYDALGRLAKLTDGANNRIVEYTYNSVGQLAQKLSGNGTYTTYAYDPAGNLVSEINYAGGTTVNSSFVYTYFNNGQQTTATDAAGHTTMYVYDYAGQLIRVQLPDGTIITYVYNDAGDRTEVITNGTPTSFASNADNQITQVGPASYSYDANGNLHAVTDTGGTTTYDFSDLNQLVSISAPDGTVTNLRYSPLGFLNGVTTTNGAATNTTNYLIDPDGLGNVVGSYDGAGALVAHFTYGLGLVGQTGPAGTGYYDLNASGNTVGITGPTGAYVNQYDYLPFGETTTLSSALPNPFTFAGQYGVMSLGTNLYSMRARVYTPATGQFLSSDPIGIKGGDANFRRYVGNDPVNNVDPSGLELVGGALGSVYEHIAPEGTPSPEAIDSSPAAIAVGFFLDALTLLSGAIDPNALIGPAGVGIQHFVAPADTLPYTVDFQNDGTAAAQVVTVAEQLDAHLDWSSFQLGSFGFGPVQFTIPSGLTRYQTTVTYQNVDGTPLNVSVSTDFNVQTGLLTCTFTSLDPATGVAPAGVFDGFLPPDDAAGIGEGFIQYIVQPKSSAATGTIINQQAAVVFDTNAPINTNTATNTIDAGAPTSTVTALPATENAAVFAVSWSGTDDAGGSGVASFDIYVSDNGGPFVLWRSTRAAASDYFVGQDGHTYGFYSVATDNVGNRQTTPNAAQATTTITLPAGFAYNSSTKILTISAGAASNLFTFVQATTADAAGLHTMYTLSLNDATTFYPDTALSQVAVNGAAGSANTAIVITSDTYVGTDGRSHESAESVQSGPGGGIVYKSNALGNFTAFLTLTGFQTSYAYVGSADSAQLNGTVGAGIENVFVTAGTYAYEFQAGGNELHFISGATAIYGYAVNPTDQDWQYDAAGSLDAFVASGNAFNYMSGSDAGGHSFFNVAVGFQVSYGISTHGNAIAYLIDSPGNDTFVGNATVSYLAGSDSSGGVFNVAEGFALIYGESFVGGTDFAYNHDPRHNILSSRWILLT